MDADVEQTHVHNVYSQIAPHFSDTRYKPWPRIEEFLNSQPSGSLIADVGCGNGKYLGLNRQAYKIGSDICPELVAIARHRGHEVAVCDCLRLPYRADLFDAVICIAVIHHLSTEERRIAALRELTRILRPGGRLLVYVWAMEQDGKKFDRQDVLVPWHLQPKYSRGADLKVTSSAMTVLQSGRRGRRGKRAESAPTPCCTTRVPSPVPLYPDRAYADNTVRQCAEKQVQQDRGVVEPLQTSTLEDSLPMQHGKVELSPNEEGSEDRNDPGLRELGYQTFLRYYHVFQRGELLRLFARDISDLVVTEEVFDHDNWCVTAQKV